MTKFVINSENVKRLSILSGQSKELISLTKPILCPSDGTLAVNLAGPRVAMSFSVDITDFETTDTDSLNFFTMGVDDFNNTLNTVSNGGVDDVLVTVDKENNNVHFINNKTGTKISKAVFNSVVTDDEAKASITAVDDMKNELLKDPITLQVTGEVSEFFESSIKFMNLLKTQNTIAVNGDSAKYADQLVVLNKKLSKSVSDTEVYFKKQLYEVVKPFVKIVGEITIYLTKDFNAAFFESKDLGFKATLGLEPARYCYPTDEEIKMAIPADDRKVVIKTTKDAIRSAFVPFNNTFRSSGDNWNWKATTLDSSKENLANGKVILKYTDYTGSAESVIPVEVVQNTEGDNNGDLIISIQVFEELLNLVPEDDLTLTYNSLPSNEMNGAGVYLETDTVKAMTTKFRKPQN